MAPLQTQTTRPDGLLLDSWHYYNYSTRGNTTRLVVPLQTQTTRPVELRQTQTTRPEELSHGLTQVEPQQTQTTRPVDGGGGGALCPNVHTHDVLQQVGLCHKNALLGHGSSQHYVSKYTTPLLHRYAAWV